MPLKTGSIAEERSCKWDTVGVKGVGGIVMIFEGLLGDLPFRGDWLRAHAKLRDLLQIFLGVLIGVGVGTDASGGPASLGAVGLPCTELTSISRLLCLTEPR